LLSALWREVSASTFTTNDSSNEIDTKERNESSILCASTLAPSESRTHHVAVA